GGLLVALNTLEQLRAEEREIRRKLITDAARELFSKKEFREVTTREIARSAGVSVGTLYNHYAGLDELFLDVFLESAGEITGLIDIALTDESPDSFRRLCRMYINYLNENMTFFKMMSRFILSGGLSENATGKLNETMRSIMDRLEKAVRLAGVENETRKSAHAIFSGLNGIVMSYACYPGRTPAELREHMLKLAEIIATTIEAAHAKASTP
ncbi:MAG: TetR/AcrR family transcriptional regulator, partial [Desulfobacteraceae bacterium]|nr:TetR/AcrR family transcriptional regulator [Desulfobacteraceae bacterium]